MKQRQTKKDRFEVLLEAIQTDFKVFGESLELVNRKVDHGFRGIRDKFDVVDKTLSRIEAKLDNKVSQQHFNSLKDKVAKLEELVKR